MFKKTLSEAVIRLLAAGFLSAKIKIVPSKKIKQADIGNLAITGSSQMLADGIQILVSGADVWGNKDQLHFSCPKNQVISTRWRALRA